jgi:hypothetical protein
VGRQQDKWKRVVQEQRRNIYDRHTMLNWRRISWFYFCGLGSFSLLLPPRSYSARAEVLVSLL